MAKTVYINELHKSLRPGTFLNATQKLTKGIWPWTEGPRARLPHHYKLRYVETHMKAPKPVYITPVPDRFADEPSPGNIPIQLLHPKVADEGLWGGEGIIEGLYRNKDKLTKARDVKIWKPTLIQQLFYSEILDNFMEIAVTRRTLDQIDECKGFDNYILQTHQVDLKSKLGMKLKQEMQQALLNKSFHLEDPVKQADVYEKYKQYMIPADEIGWLGLEIQDAENKLMSDEEAERLRNTRPHKYALMEKMVEKMKAGEFKVVELPGMYKKPKEAKKSFASSMLPTPSNIRRFVNRDATK